GYRIDFAVKHPEEPGRMVLAIECDGASYHSAPTARDRDRLRQEQLERLGWTFHRIWSQDWFNNKEQEIERAKQAYERALRRDHQPKADDVTLSLDTDAGIASPGRMATPSTASVGAAASGFGVRRKGPCPVAYPPGTSIDNYSRPELINLIRWIESDGLLRTQIDLCEEAIRQLGFKRRGHKIVAVLGEAIAEARGGAQSRQG
ncbi:MAG TPA: DUF559 domain-containing protein, partial [Solirubrobacterales bacterium]